MQLVNTLAKDGMLQGCFLNLAIRNIEIYNLKKKKFVLR